MSIWLIAVWLLFAFPFQARGGDLAEQKADKKSSYAVSAKAARLIEPIEARQLADDRSFLATLERVFAAPESSGADHADAFALMLRKIGLGFTGAARIPKGANYLRTFGGISSTFIRYQDQLSPLKLDATDLLKVAESQCATHVVRCSHALLLATLVDRTAATPVVDSFVDINRINAAEVPPILLHYLSLAAVLTRDSELTMSLGALIDQVRWEESQEDVLCAMSVFSVPAALQMTEAFATSALASRLNEAVKTALAVLRTRLPDDQFRERYARIVDTVTDRQRKASLLRISDDDFAPLDRFGEDKGSVKTWDGFTVTRYGDGMMLSYGTGFRDFISK
jgi:hypothetical protein